MPFPSQARGAAASLFLLAPAPAAAPACELVPHGHDLAYRFSGSSCDARVLHDGSAITEMGPARDLGGGFVVQALFDGTRPEGHKLYTLGDPAAAGITNLVV